MIAKPRATALPAGVDELCDRFEEALQRGQRPALVEYLDTESPNLDALADLAALELHYRLGEGEAVAAADYFAAYPELRENRAVAVRLVGVEYRAAAARDPAISEAEFRRRYPELADRQEWSNGPWVAAARPGPSVSDRTPPPMAGLGAVPDFLAGILGPPDPAHPGYLGRLGDYRILGVLGRGGMGVVLRAVDTYLGRPTAVKVMLPKIAALPEARERFLREARATAVVAHPRVVPIYHVGEAVGVPFIAMPLLAGRTLKARLQAGPPPTVAEVLRIGREVAEGLEAAHAAGLVHRDLKPDNIWLEAGPDGPHVRILDFGLARVADGVEDNSAPLTRIGGVLGTPAYMSPEQAAGKPVDARTDLWGLGVVLHEMATGRPPFAGPDVYAVLTAIAVSAPPPLPGSPALSALVGRLLAKRPDDRPPSATAVKEELRRLEAGAATRSPGRRRWRPRRRTFVLALAACLILGGLSVAWTLLKPPPAVRVAFVEVHHFAKLDEREAEPRGLIGRESFDVRLGDQATLEVPLTAPGYCYLAAFRPDGVVELLFPEASGEPPPLTDRPRYPSKARGVVYGLTDGTGLWVFAAVVSARPLPTYAQASAGKPPPWQAGKPDCPPGAMWWDDGVWSQDLRPAGAVRATRGAGVEVPGKAAVARVVDWMKSLAGDGAHAAAVGVVVRPAIK